MNPKIDITEVELHTERLLLRPWSQGDLEDFYAYASVEGVGSMAGWQTHQNIKETECVLKMFMEGKHTFAIVKDENVIGSVGVEPYDEMEFPEFSNERVRELGFVLAKEYWGQGLMKEAVDEVQRWLFEEIHLDRILCGHFLWNHQSQRVQEKCGFTPYRTIQFETQFNTTEETLVSIIAKEQWQSRCLTQIDKSSL